MPIPWWLILLLIVVVVGVGCYFLYRKGKEMQERSENAQEQMRNRGTDPVSSCN